MLDTREQTLGSKTFQYQEEKKTNLRKQEHFVSSGERTRMSPNLVLIVRYVERRVTRLRPGVVRRRLCLYDKKSEKIND